MAKTLFVRTERASKELKGQAALVLESLDSRTEPATVAQITEDIKNLGLVTRQDPERIAAYYLCIFKKQGLVRTVEPPKEAEGSTEQEPVSEEVAEEIEA